METIRESCLMCGEDIKIYLEEGGLISKDIVSGAEGIISFQNTVESRYKSESYTFYICDDCTEKAHQKGRVKKIGHYGI